MDPDRIPAARAPAVCVDSILKDAIFWTGFWRRDSVIIVDMVSRAVVIIGWSFLLLLLVQEGKGQAPPTKSEDTETRVYGEVRYVS